MRDGRPSLLGRSTAACILAVMVSAPAGGQTLRGDVVVRDTVPVVGAIVTLVDSLAGEPARVLSGAGGRFELRAPRPGTYRVRVEAVGYSSVLSLPFTLGAAERREQRIHLVEATRALAAVQVRARTRCDTKPEEGTQVALLWTEARKTLTAVLLSTGRTAYLAFDQDVIDYDSATRRITSATRTSMVARADEGYEALPPRQLRDRGYIQRSEQVAYFYGPDARVLLSEEFAAMHCFAIAERDPSSPDRVGLRFTPVDPPRRGTAGIRGTLWLERQGYALDRVEFLYTPRQSDEHPDTLFGGSVRFERLPSGHVIIRRWELRTPTFAVAEGERATPRGVRNLQAGQLLDRIVGMRVARGMARPFEEEPPPVPAVTADLRRSAPPPSCFGLAGDPTRGELPGVVTARSGRAVVGARVRATWTHASERTGGSGTEQWAESGADANGRFVLCALPRGVELRIVAATDRGSSGGTRVTLGAGAPAALSLVLDAGR